MSQVIGVLLPRSTDHPAIGFDILDGLRLKLASEGLGDVRLVSENIGFGENRKDIYTKAEKLIVQDDASCIVAYLSPANAESLYPLMQASGKPLIVLDAGMNYPGEPPSPHAIYIALQGIQAAYLAGKKTGQHGDVIMATSFYDGGYRGPWAYNRGISDAGGKIIHHYVSHYKEEEFTVKPLLEALDKNGSTAIGACFSTYLATMFLNSLHRESEALPQLDFYCSSYMLEEQTMGNYTLPASGRYYAYVPWFSSLNNEVNNNFKKEIKGKKNKDANLFHLMGWEAATVLSEYMRRSKTAHAPIAQLLEGWAYNSPRGTVAINKDTHHAFGPVHYVEMKQTAGNAPGVELLETIETDAAEYVKILNDQPEGVASGWVNQYLCT